MNKILVPTDFSETSQNALEFAVEIAKVSGATVTVFNSYQVSIAAGLNAPPVEYIEAVTVERQKEHQQRLAQLVEKFSTTKYVKTGSPLDFNQVVVQGLATDSIEDLVENVKYDLIVMGTKGATGVSTYLWGSITSQVIGRVKVPVLAVPYDASFKGIYKIVYATNFDEKDRQTIDDLKQFGDLFEAELTCLHISKSEEKSKRDKEKLSLLEADFWFTPIDRLNFELVKSKSVEKGLTDYLKESKANILAVLPQDRGFVEDLLHSSVTKRLAIHSETPVLVMRK